MERVELKITERDKKDFSDAFDECWSRLKVNNYYVVKNDNNRESETMIQQSVIQMFSQEMYDFMLRILTRISKCRLDKLCCDNETIMSPVLPEIKTEKISDDSDYLFNTNNNHLKNYNNGSVDDDVDIPDVDIDEQLEFIVKNERGDICQDVDHLTDDAMPVDFKEDETIGDVPRLSLVESEASDVFPYVTTGKERQHTMGDSYCNINKYAVTLNEKQQLIHQVESNSENLQVLSQNAIQEEATEKRLEKNKKRKHSDNDNEDVDDDHGVIKYSNAKKSKPTSTPIMIISPQKNEEKEEHAGTWKGPKKGNDDKKWTFFEHKGPVFPPDYEPLPPNVEFFYYEKEMKLSQDTEEVATLYARVLHLDCTTKKVFNDNFFNDWREVMTENEKNEIIDLNKCNFQQIHEYFNQKEKEKESCKVKNEQIKERYGTCIIDGHEEKLDYFKIEPPGLFRGRGENPKMGKLKKRVVPEDVIINCSKDSKIPKAPTGHKWKEIRHDQSVEWLASWAVDVSRKTKYVVLNPSSKLKANVDMEKFEIARKLGTSIEKIRAQYRKDWRSKDLKIRQRGVALYFIDKFGLSPGDRIYKSQTDVVGCCTLQVEHISLHENFEDKKNVVVFDFLSKNSMSYYNVVPVEECVFKNLQLFKKDKSEGDWLFDCLNLTMLNKYLTNIMDGLTSKIFRIYNASCTLQQQLDQLTNPQDSLPKKILSYNAAVQAVTIICAKNCIEPMKKFYTQVEAKKHIIKEAEENVDVAKGKAEQGSAEGKKLFEKANEELIKLKDQLVELLVQQINNKDKKMIPNLRLFNLDPRIIVAWCKKNNVPIEKIFTKFDQNKFKWALDMASPDFVF